MKENVVIAARTMPDKEWRDRCIEPQQEFIDTMYLQRCLRIGKAAGDALEERIALRAEFDAVTKAAMEKVEA